MFVNNLKLALQSLRTTKLRSFLTMLGVIIGVFSVVVIVSIGVGIRQQISSQIKHLGADLITVIPGQNAASTTTGLFSQLNLEPTLGTGALTEQDLTRIGSVNGIGTVVPMSGVTGAVVINGSNFNPEVIATTDGFPTIVNQDVTYGNFFHPDDVDQYEAVIGQTVALNMFKSEDPIGQSFTIRGQRFTVNGVFGQFNTSPLTPISNYNNAIFIPYSIGQTMSGGQPQIYEIFAKPDKISDTNMVAGEINSALLSERNGQTNFTVLQQKENLEVANSTLNTLTVLIAAVAAVSLLVGGIGIMNIMLVSVMERTHEIGIRKAIGGTNRQIMMQFMIESAIIGLVGGIIGVVLSVFADLIISYFTSLQPAITLPIIVISILIALAAGIFFGAMPALKAAKKNPVESLRHE